jgi:formylglycine-generating enzyme required for sulfatase activity
VGVRRQGGGSTTPRSYGAGRELLPRYAWFVENSDDRTWPVGQKRPNEWGFFDMPGGVANWCQEPSFVYPFRADGLPVEDREHARPATELLRALRGGSLFERAALHRPAFRYQNRPGFRVNSIGLRPARTIR